MVLCKLALLGERRVGLFYDPALRYNATKAQRREGFNHSCDALALKDTKVFTKGTESFTLKR
jgi:hypothetical protein